jgi:ATP-dependent RNA helicase DDX41
LKPSKSESAVAICHISESYDCHPDLAGYRVPEFIKSIDDPMEKYHAAGTVGKACAVCGGLGHSIVNCPKLEDAQRRQMAGQTGREGGGGGGY